MTTAVEMITDALRVANVLDENEAPSAEMGVAGLRTLNQMMGQWDRDGIRLGWHQVAELDDDLPIEYQDERGVKYNLAVELAGEYGVDPTVRVTQIANETYAALSKAHRLEVESALDLLPAESAARWPGGFIETG